jgi:hypothetical protein
LPPSSSAIAWFLIASGSPERSFAFGQVAAPAGLIVACRTLGCPMSWIQTIAALPIGSRATRGAAPIPGRATSIGDCQAAPRDDRGAASTMWMHDRDAGCVGQSAPCS